MAGSCRSQRSRGPQLPKGIRLRGSQPCLAMRHLGKQCRTKTTTKRPGDQQSFQENLTAEEETEVQAPQVTFHRVPLGNHRDRTSGLATPCSVPLPWPWADQAGVDEKLTNGGGGPWAPGRPHRLPRNPPLTSQPSARRGERANAGKRNGCGKGDYRTATRNKASGGRARGRLSRACAAPEPGAGRPGPTRPREPPCSLRPPLERASPGQHPPPRVSREAASPPTSRSRSRPLQPRAPAASRLHTQPRAPWEALI